MGASQHAFVNVAGVAPRHGARIVYVWDRSDGPQGRVLLGSGHVVRGVRPPGIQAGQFSITFRLPPESSIDDLFLTDDVNTLEPLTGVTITPCTTVYSAATIRAGVSPQDAAVSSGT